MNLIDRIRTIVKGDDTPDVKLGKVELALDMHDETQQAVAKALEEQASQNGRRRSPSRKAPRRDDGHDARIPFVGSEFSTEHDGKTHTVEVLEEGKLRYKGEEFTSVSSIAKTITGKPSANGYDFFGLQEMHGIETEEAEQAETAEEAEEAEEETEQMLPSTAASLI